VSALQPLTIIRVGGKEVPYYFGEGVLDHAAALVDQHAGSGRRIVVTSRGVELLTGPRFRASFGGAVTETVIVADGEESKSFETANSIIGDLLNAEARRDAVILALGGGAVGDLAGFVAAIYLRGIDLVHIPTTLLSQIDSSIGGKVAVNHASGKNLIGAFHQPRAILADPAVLRTLSRREMVSGIYEALKGGVVGDPSLFELCESTPDALLACDREAISNLVRKAVVLKAKIVNQDERENDQRRLLNYGHTIGHGIEAASGFSGLTHGEAVAWGILAANAIAVRRGMLASSVASRIEQTIRCFDPAPIPAIDRGALQSAVSRDKKFRTDRQVMVLPREIGRCEIVEDVSAQEIGFGIEAILN
jgi:3-dehydroquinate synthase